MSTFDRWNKMAGLLNESAEPQQTVEAEEAQTSTMNESDLRGMIAELAKEILSEGLVDYIKKGASMGNVFDPAAVWSPTKQMQWGLALLGYLDPNSFRDIDGKFGPKTKKAVERFQKQQGLKPDGAWGPKTNAAFLAAAKAARDAGMDAGLGDITDPSPTPDSLGTVNATEQWLTSLLQYNNLGGKVLRMGGASKRQRPAEIGDDIAPGSHPPAADADMTVADAEMPKELDSWLDSLAASGASHVADHVRAIGAEAREAGDPAPYDPDPSSMQFLPGIEPNLFQNAIVGTAGRNEIDVADRDWEALGKPDLKKLASAMGVDRINLYKKMF